MAVSTLVRKKAQTNREAWLTEALRIAAPWLTRYALAHGVILPERPKVRLSVGWPGGRRKKGTVLGQCWTATAAADGVSQIFISPIVADGRNAIAVLVHEYAHALDNNESGHSGRFTEIARAIGLEGKPTETHAGPDLAEVAQIIIKRLGRYPHAALSPDTTDGTKKQTTRMIKLTCGCEDPRILRLSRKAIDAGAIVCAVCEERFAPSDES